MFEPVHDTWSRYLKLLGAVLPAGDPRLLRAAEVHTRLAQLDLLLGRVTEILDLARRSGQDPPHAEFLQAWDWLSIYTDAFYFFGWRVLDLVNEGAAPGFPHLAPVRPAGMLVVRANLLDFPEGQGEYFRHALEFRDELQENVGKALRALQAERGSD